MNLWSCALTHNHPTREICQSQTAVRVYVLFVTSSAGKGEATCCNCRYQVTIALVSIVSRCLYVCSHPQRVVVRVIC